MVVAVFLHTDDQIAASGHEFDADAACTGKEVEGANSVIFKIHVSAGQYIEQVLLGKIRCGACLEERGGQAPPFIYSTDYSHEVMACRSRFAAGFMMNTCRMRFSQFRQ